MSALSRYITPVLTGILLLLMVCVQAQQKPQYTQYPFNNYLVNPAFAGIENYVDLKLGHRSQWTGLDGAPKTTYLTINAPLGENFLNGGAGSGNPNERSYLRTYMAAEPHHGIGLQLITDKAGLISQNTIAGSYAYHLGLSPTSNLAVGITAGVNQYSINSSEITVENPIDPAINNGNNSKWNPDVSAGVLLYGPNYYTGFSVQQALSQSIFSSSYNQSKTVPHFLFTGGLRLYMTDDLTLLPSVLVKFIDPAPTTYDVNMKLAFRDDFWVGGSYRKNDSFGILAGFNLSSLINVGYSYDITTSSLNAVSKGSHEIVIGIMLNNTYNVKCPQRSF
ncbi:type IX secretion system membrane protein PorP/SprF [Mucilaginibacter sp. UR6-1]|uniref:PorP/SprF family type IX secretion system membrane protein n=1 Tax=Mucilaginibacter sp. UR6-1 TaxID=1435643 RepID=UPI001E62824D|nr:type IX secretion system membrane protein PorP/SprF [Mucilaginibacter sp. UR6-1]MCC8409399.1 type IX secretion system membrane protein PorP/SprF [Mucilaginibacter sp. UR6-1]